MFISRRKFQSLVRILAKAKECDVEEARRQLFESLPAAAVTHLKNPEGKMPRGRKPKVAKPPTKPERSERLRSAIMGLDQDLIENGFAPYLKPPGAIHTIASPLTDPKTNGMIGHVEEALGTYIQRVGIADNYQQRPPFDHVTDSIYRRLIRDFIDGAMMPEAKVAALSAKAPDKIVHELNESGISFSIIDGLQRLYCFCIAILLVWRRDALVQDGIIPKEAWSYFSDVVEKAGDAQTATADILRRKVRYEIFYTIGLEGLLHYMVTFNTGQRRMSLPVQLEIMQKPLIDELKQKARINVWHEMQKMPGMAKKKELFAAADLVLATKAFITNSAQVTASSEAELFLNQDQAFLENVGEITDVVDTLARITTEVQSQIVKVYADDPSQRFILSGGGTFFIGFVAACGYIRNRNNQKMLDGALDKLMMKLHEPREDPLSLEYYQRALGTITSSRGKSIRRLVNDTFLRFFSGATTELEWMDTASQITGVTERGGHAA